MKIFYCATLPPDEALELWRRELGSRSIKDFPPSAKRLLSTVFRNIRKSTQEVPGQKRLQGRYRKTWARNFQLREAALNVISLLGQHSIDTLVLKGVYLTSVVYQDMGARPSVDFDLLVALEQAEHAIQILLAEDWSVVSERLIPTERMENAITLQKGEDVLDLHWSVLREARTWQNNRVFWERAGFFTLGERVVGTLCPTHHLFHLLVACDREPENQVRYLVDIHFVMKHWESEIDYQEIQELLRERHLVSRLHRLPLAELGWTQLLPRHRAGLLDRFWSESSRYLHDTKGEWNYALFPFLDYWLNYRGQATPGWGWRTYLLKRLELQGISDFFRRGWQKLARMMGGGKEQG
jgi:Uncharacterised nucleotidyltransferase